MTPQLNVEKVIQRFDIDINAKKDQQIFDELRQAHARSKESRPDISIIGIWRRIMKSRITRFTTAAMILVAAGLAIHFSGGSVDLTTIALGEITEAMQKQPWLHQTTRGFQSSGSDLGETWFGFEAKIGAIRWSNGKANFLDINAHRNYQYEPENNSLTITYAREADFPVYLSSSVAVIESMQKMLEESGAEIVTKSGQYQGHPVQVQEGILSPHGENGPTQRVTFYIRPDSKLLLAVGLRVSDANGDTTTEGKMIFDYPQSGPSNIYDLGVPRDAKIINEVPSEDYQSIWEQYRQSRARATKEYIAIVAHAERLGSDVITRLDVDYKSGQTHRMENHSVFKPGETYDEFWPRYKEQLGNTFDSLLAWAVKDCEQEEGWLTIFIEDGQYSRHARRKSSGSWKLYDKHYSLQGAGPPIGSLARLGWPQLGDGNVIEDDYAKANNLICIERLQQGSVYSGTVSLPARILFYIDPEKDYICVGRETEWCPDAEWQRDKNWLHGVEPEKIPDGWAKKQNVTELTKAANGHWYPKVIVVKQTGVRKDYKDAPLKVSSFITIYVETNPEFPEDIFDLEKLPGQ